MVPQPLRPWSSEQRRREIVDFQLGTKEMG
jgi:hypothetical protein